MFYFDDNAKKCQMFIYGGCGGNNNRFQDIAQCYSECLSPSIVKNSGLFFII